MRTIPRFLALLLAFSVLAGPLPAARAEVLNRIVASIDGDPVTLYELEQYEKKRSAAVSAMGGQLSRTDVLQALITEKLVEREIAAKGIRVEDEDINRYIERIREQNKLTEDQLKEALQQQGLSWDQYLKQVRGEIEKVQLLNREIRGRVNITDEDVERAYEADKQKYALPSRLHLRHIVLRLAPNAPDAVAEVVTERITDIRKRIVKGKEDFAEVAKQVSEDPAAAHGGDLGEVEPDKILPEFEEALPNLKTGEVSQPIRTEAGLHLIQVVERISESFTPLKEVFEAIKEELYAKALDERYRRWLLEDLQKRHYVEIRL